MTSGSSSDEDINYYVKNFNKRNPEKHRLLGTKKELIQMDSTSKRDDVKFEVDYTEDSIDDQELIKPAQKTYKVSHHHVFVFILTFTSYALYHATRKTFSNVKYTMGEEWSPTNSNKSLQFAYDRKQWNYHNVFHSVDDAKVYMGFLDLGFLLAYAVGLFFFGILGDRINLRYVLTFGMITSAASVFAFGCISAWTNYTQKWYYVFIWCLNGFFQATGWPCTVAIVGCWFGKSSRGLILGIWSANASFGNIIGSYAVGGVLKYGYEYAFLVTSTMLFAGAIIMFFGLLISPKEIGMEEADEGHKGASDRMARFSSETHLIEASGNSITISKSSAMPFHKVLLLPGVIPYSLSYSFLKPVNYAFFFWLPFYLSSKYNWPNSVADNLSVWYDYGGIAGGIIFGYISDKMKFRSPVMIIMLLISPITIFVYQASPDDKTINAVLMFMIGVFLNGAASILSTAITADLGRQEAIKGNETALGTVTGIIDGTASFSAAIWQVFVPLLNKALGWKVVFYFFIALTVLSLISLTAPIIRDFKQWRSKRNPSA